MRSRIESLAGEARVNLIRLAAVFAFYLRHLVALSTSEGAARESGQYHIGATIVAGAWFAVVVAIHICLSRRYLPAWLKYASTAFDLLMVTLLGMMRADPRAPIILLYFPVIVSAAVRLSLPLVWFATMGSIVGYLSVLAYYAWHVIGFDRYYATPELRIPRGDEALFALALLVTGAFAGQVVRQARRLTRPLHATITAESAAAPPAAEEPTE
ncbi:MAG: hypothetical protein QOF78_645 [Phycisphaerales bacterium]|jgi:hypothetical protein|nr:hypothetical protein [Phycisphaerales bacterium]